MLIRQQLGLKLAQKPVLTQSLRQLVKLLALNKLDLRQEINQELIENPVLEAGLEEGASADGDDAPAEAEEASAFDEIDLEAFFEDLDSGSAAPPSEVIEKTSFETFLSKPDSLTDHLMWQLSLSHAKEKVADAGQEIIGNLNEDGYLTASLEEIAGISGATLTQAEKALVIVQEFDPVGVAARDLRECLMIQLRAHDEVASDAWMIVENYWSELESTFEDRIAAASGLTIERVRAAMEMVRHLDPRPGQRYSANETRVVEPDVQFVNTPEGFRIILNDDDIPDLRLNRSYRGLLRRGRAEKEVRDYIRERYNSAIQLLRNIEQRRQTIRSVCEMIVGRQESFLHNGVDHMRPLMIKEVAEMIGVHPSTVSRAVANKYAHTPHGVYELRFFFSEAVQGPSGDAVPLMVLKRRVKKMIDEEDSRKPLTDDKISKLLREGGIHVTRRTVAKYREDLGIASTHVRRRQAK